MKIITKMSAALLVLGLASQVKAAVGDPVVYLTGSTAFRSTIEAALADNNGTNAGGVFDAGTVDYETWGSSSEGSANYMVFHGTIQGSPVYIDCAWSGSEAGIASACNTTLANSDRNGAYLQLAGSPETWVQATNASVALTYPGTINTPAPASGIMESGSHGADLAQADTSQAVSWTPFVAGTQTALKDYGSEGVVTFTISRNVQPAPSNEWLHCSNITLPQINVLLANGAVPASFISGNTNDSDFIVYAVGRNKGSGTRMNMLSDSTYGSHNVVHQYSIGYGCGDPGDPAQNVDALWLTNEANNGYESGGGVGKALADTGGSTTSGSCQQADPFNGGVGWFAIGYISPSDALSTGNAGPAGAVTTNNWCTVDGVFSDNATIENGSWWYWGHEHLYGKYQISGIQDTVGNVLFSSVVYTLENSPSSFGGTYGSNPLGHDPGIPYSLMNCHKVSDVSFPVFGQN